MRFGSFHNALFVDLFFSKREALCRPYLRGGAAHLAFPFISCLNVFEL